MLEEKQKYLVGLIMDNDDENAFQDLFNYYYFGLLSFSNSIIKNKQQSEEIVEDVFIKLWNNRKSIDIIENLSQYLYTCAKNGCLNYLKKKKCAAIEDFGENFLYSLKTPETLMINNENVNEILFAINDLPPRCRLIFRLVKDEGMKYEEVAELLNISTRTVNAQMCIAVKKIGYVLKRTMPERFGNLRIKKK